MRPLFKNKSTETPLNSEIEYIRNYIDLVNLRLGECIQVSVEIPEEIQNALIPVFILQPIIENAVEHGFDGNYKHAEIKIRFVMKDGLAIIIFDNGCGFSEEKMSDMNRQFQTFNSLPENGDKIGLVNVNMRLKLLYGKQYGLTILSRENGSAVQVLLPYPEQL